MSLLTMEGVTSIAGAKVASPLIKKYQKPWWMRDAVKSILTWDVNQICPCGITHWAEKSCSSVIAKIAARKPNKLLMALKIQKQRCKDSAAMVLNNPEMLLIYSREKNKKNNNGTGVMSDLACVSTDELTDCDWIDCGDCDVPSCH